MVTHCDGCLAQRRPSGAGHGSKCGRAPRSMSSRGPIAGAAYRPSPPVGGGLSGAVARRSAAPDRSRKAPTGTLASQPIRCVGPRRRPRHPGSPRRCRPRFSSGTGSPSGPSVVRIPPRAFPGSLRSPPRAPPSRRLPTGHGTSNDLSWWVVARGPLPALKILGHTVSEKLAAPRRVSRIAPGASAGFPGVQRFLLLQPRVHKGVRAGFQGDTPSVDELLKGLVAQGVLSTLQIDDDHAWAGQVVVDGGSPEPGALPAGGANVHDHEEVG